MSSILVTSLPFLVALPIGSQPDTMPALTHDESFPYTRDTTDTGTEPDLNFFSSIGLDLLFEIILEQEFPYVKTTTVEVSKKKKQSSLRRHPGNRVFLRLPSNHSHLTRVIFITQSVGGYKSFQHSSDNFSFILFVWKQEIGKFSVQDATIKTSKSAYSNPSGFSLFLPHNSFYGVIIF
jgi:hypothetical protein